MIDNCLPCSFLESYFWKPSCHCKSDDDKSGVQVTQFFMEEELKIPDWPHFPVSKTLAVKGIFLKRK